MNTAIPFMQQLVRDLLITKILTDFGTQRRNDDAAAKLLYLARRNITKDWKMSVREWQPVMNQLAILVAARFMPQLQ